MFIMWRTKSRFKRRWYEFQSSQSAAGRYVSSKKTLDVNLSAKLASRCSVYKPVSGHESTAGGLSPLMSLSPLSPLSNSSPLSPPVDLGLPQHVPWKQG